MRFNFGEVMLFIFIVGLIIGGLIGGAIGFFIF
jgi:hypothetical protein